jgi:hypothetical protein
VLLPLTVVFFLLWSQEGIIALWKGWLPSVIGVIPYVGLNFAVYETLKDNVLKFYGVHILPDALLSFFILSVSLSPAPMLTWCARQNHLCKPSQAT